VSAPRAVVFDLGGTLVQWPKWDEDAPVKWGFAYDALMRSNDGRALPARDAFVQAMRGAEQAHWVRVDREHWSGPPTSLVREGFERLGVAVGDRELTATLDGYARAIAGWSTVFPDSRDTLVLLRERGYRLGLLSNTWWAAEWHNADIAAHGLAGLLDELVYTSDQPHSKPHPSVFREISARLEVAPEACVMIGDRRIDDVAGGKRVGMRGVWRRNDSGFPTGDVEPDAIVDQLSELPPLLRSWGGA
jgi:putative hydrolase of the HAD superfamily